MMNGNRDEAMRAKDLAEAKFAEKNYSLAKKLAQKAQSMCPEMDGILQFLDVVDVFITYEAKVGGLTDWYNILGVSPICDEETIKRRYRKMALSLHPDKNNSIGSTDAFTIIAEAFDVLSDKAKRSEYDAKRRLNLQKEKNNYNDKSNEDLSSSNLGKSTTCTTAPNHHHQQKQAGDEAPNEQPSPYPTMPSHTSTGLFWTICTTCMTYHCYGEIFHGKKLMCASCLNPFSADKVPTGPPDGEATETSTASNREQYRRDNKTAPASKEQKAAPTGSGQFRSRWEARKAAPFHHHRQGPAASHESPNPTGSGFRSRWEARRAAQFHHQQAPTASYENPNPTGFGFKSRWEARKAAPFHPQQGPDAGFHHYQHQGFPYYYRQQPNNVAQGAFFTGDRKGSSSMPPIFSGTPMFSNCYAGQSADSRQQMNMGPNINLDLGTNPSAQVRTEETRHNNMMKRPFSMEQHEEEGGNNNKRRNAGNE